MAELGKRRPWYVAPLLAGFGGVLGVAVTLGVISSGARVEPKEAHASVVGSATAAAHAEQSAAEQRWRERMEQKLDLALERIAHLEGRMDKR